MNRTILIFPAALLALVMAQGCSSKSSPSAATSAKKGGGATSATSAKTSGQKAGQTALQNKARAVSKGAATGGTGKQKGGGATNATAAKAAGQKTTTTSKVVLDQSKATDKGASLPSPTAAVACDADHELEAFCADETTATFCTAGHWYALDCAGAEQGFCGEDLAANTVDCYAAADLVVTGDVVQCNDANEGVAFCSDDDHEVFCSSGSWYELSCSAAVPGDWCGEEEDTHVVDCGQ
jgi:hypothetical protein